MKYALTILILLISLSFLLADTGWGPAFIGSPYLPEQIGEWGQFNYIEHPTIRMVSEDVDIVLHRLGSYVFAEFVFENTGEETNVEMVYPLQSDWRSTTLYNMKVFEEGEDYIYRVNFNCVLHDDENDDELSFVDWATWDIHFKEGETKTIYVQYEAPYGMNTEMRVLHDKWQRVVSETEMGGPIHKLCRYILYTGASWKGTIGEGSISFWLTPEVCWEDLIDPDGVGLLQGSFEFLDVSSHLPADEFGSYDGKKICDADSMNPDSVKTVWSEGVDGIGEGEWIRLAPLYSDYHRYYGIDKLKGILVYNGYFSDVDLFWNNSRVSNLDVSLFKNDNELYTDSIIFLEPKGWPIVEYMTPSKEYCIFDRPYDVDEVLLTITDAYKGMKYDDTCIAEVVPIYADPRTHHSASSTLVEDYSDIFRYHPIKIDDGDSSTCWVEGADGDGEGEWVEFQWDYPKDIIAMKILPGFAQDETFWSENGRPKRITVECFNNDNCILEIPLEIEDMMKVQAFYLNPEAVCDCSKVRITIDEVYPGDKYEDTCISEVEFLEM
jgi:hypothetical protein